MATKKISITLPEELLEKAEEFGKATYSSRSELIRHALSMYLAGRIIPVGTATPEDLRGDKKGREEFERGEFVTLDDDTRHELEDRPRAKRA